MNIKEEFWPVSAQCMKISKKKVSFRNVGEPSDVSRNLATKISIRISKFGSEIHMRHFGLIFVHCGEKPQKISEASYLQQCIVVDT